MYATIAGIWSISASSILIFILLHDLYWWVNCFVLDEKLRKAPKEKKLIAFKLISWHDDKDFVASTDEYVGFWVFIWGMLGWMVVTLGALVWPLLVTILFVWGSLLFARGLVRTTKASIQSHVKEMHKTEDS